MSWRDQSLSVGMYLLIAHQLVLVLNIMLTLAIPLNLVFLLPLFNVLFSSSLWLDLFGFLLVGIGFHAMGRFFTDDEDLKTQSRTIGILLAFWTVPMFMYRASLQLLTTTKDLWTIISLILGIWNFNALGIPAAAIKEGIYMLWVFSVWWPVLLIVHGITGFGLVAIPFFLESTERKLQLSPLTQRFELKHVKLFFIATSATNIILFVVAVLTFQPLIPQISELASQLNTITDDNSLKQSIISLQGMNLFLFIIILGIKQLLAAIFAFLSWNYGFKVITSIQKQARDRYLQKKKEEKEKHQNNDVQPSQEKKE